MAELRALLFDFDGTLVRTREASWRLFQQTNEKFGLRVGTPSDFYQMFDQNFYAALDEAAAANTNAQGEEVREHFQGLLRTSYTPDLVPGMARVVRALAGYYTLVVLSANTMETVRRILLADDLATCFAHVFSGDVSPSKHEAIRLFLKDPSYSCGRRCSPSYDESSLPRLHQPDEVMLVTDTVGDVEEAQRAGIRVAAVAWGMHLAEDLERAGAEFVCIWPEELVAYLRPGEVCSTGVCSLPSAAMTQGPSSSAPPPGGSREAGPKPSPAMARRARRTAAASRVGERLAAAAPAPSTSSHGCSCDDCLTATAGQEGLTPGLPPVDPVLRRALITLMGQPANDVVHAR
jgi:phosphoglycolate phosphatase